MSRQHLRKWGAAAVVALCALVLFVALRGQVSHRQHPPNLVLLMVDTMRPDDVGCYGYARATTPNLDRFARQGVLFRRAYSTTSWTLPAVASLLTGRLPSQHHTRAIGDVLPASIPTLATLLRQRHYRTEAVSANFAFVHPTNIPKPMQGLGLGFDSFEVLSQPADPSDGEGEMVLGQLIRTVRADAVTNRLKDLLRTTPEPFFLFGVYIDPHYGYDPPAPYASMFESHPLSPKVTGLMRDVQQLAGPLSRDDIEHLHNLYDGEIRLVDSQIDGFLTALQGLPLADRTVVVIVSDHGEEFAEHGKMLHGQSLYEESVRIFLSMRGPGVPGGIEVDTPASLADVMPTLLEFAGIGAPTDIYGRSLTPQWAHRWWQRPDPPRPLLFELDNEPELLNGPRLHSRAVRENDWKLITSLNGTRELYDLGADPDERHDVASTNPAVISRLGAIMAQHPTAPPTPQGRPTLTDAERERLRALGYGTHGD